MRRTCPFILRIMLLILKIGLFVAFLFCVRIRMENRLVASSLGWGVLGAEKENGALGRCLSTLNLKSMCLVCLVIGAIGSSAFAGFGAGWALLPWFWTLEFVF